MVEKLTETTKLTESKRAATSSWLVLLLCSYSNMEMGLALSIIGTTLPELQIYFHSTLKIMSFFFLAFGSSAILGNLFTPLFVKFCEMNLLIAATRVINGVALFLSVMTGYAGVGMVCFALIGFSVGVAGSVSWILCQLLFPHKPFVFHVVSTATAFGGLVSPLIAEPFVSDVMPDFHCAHNGTVESVGTNNSSVGHLCSQQPLSSMTSLKYVFIILALLSLPSFVGSISIFMRNKIFMKSSDISQNTKTENKDSGTRLAFNILILFMFFSNYAVVFVHGSYITTVAEKGHLKISAERATGMASVFWFMVFLGRLCGIAMSVFLRQVIILWICFIGCIVSILLLIFSVYQTWEVYYWIGSFLLGLFAGPQYAAVMNWSKEYITLTPIMIGLYNVFSYSGDTVLPFAVGQLIARFGELSEPYFCLSFEASKLLLLCLVQIVGKFVSGKGEFCDLHMNP